jgi:hypothetical protein
MTEKPVDKDPFAVIFEELAKSAAEVSSDANVSIVLPDTSLQELREIDELRRLALETAQPQLQFYTST